MIGGDFLTYLSTTVDKLVDKYVKFLQIFGLLRFAVALLQGVSYILGQGMINSERTRAGRDSADITVRVAAYPENEQPEVTEVAASNPRSATPKFLRLVMEKVEEFGGGVPEAAVREVIENLLHASYKGVVISVLDGGRTVRVSDKGPGIEDKDRAMEFGFSGATPEALRDIRGIGAGLGIAQVAVFGGRWPDIHRGQHRRWHGNDDHRAGRRQPGRGPSVQRESGAAQVS